MKIGIFPGSFDPFTTGHKDIVDRALPLFDKIIIGIGINGEKTPMLPVETRRQMIQKAFANNAQVEVDVYEGLTVDFARKHHAQFIIRGIRNIVDFEYESNIAQMNKELSGIETIFLNTTPQLRHISATIVRDLHRHGQDISPYVP